MLDTMALLLPKTDVCACSQAGVGLTVFDGSGSKAPSQTQGRTPFGGVRRSGAAPLFLQESDPEAEGKKRDTVVLQITFGVCLPFPALTTVGATEATSAYRATATVEGTRAYAGGGAAGSASRSMYDPLEVPLSRY